MGRVTRAAMIIEAEGEDGRLQRVLYEFDRHEPIVVEIVGEPRGVFDLPLRSLTVSGKFAGGRTWEEPMPGDADTPRAISGRGRDEG